MNSLTEYRENFSFTNFLVRKWLPEEKLEQFELQLKQHGNTEDYQKEAYGIFWKALGKQKIISRPTIRRWFSLGKFKAQRNPDIRRNHMFDVAILLGLSRDELNEYLVEGILQPQVQINDYVEIIFLYGLENRKSIEECEDMIQLFLKHMDDKVELSQKSHTDKMWKMYETVHREEPDVFLQWMIQNAVMFKGYSRMVQKAFVEHQTWIHRILKNEAKEQMIRILADTDYYERCRKNHWNAEDYETSVARFLRSERYRRSPLLIRGKRQLLEEYYQTAFPTGNYITDMLAELYAPVLQRKEQGQEKRIVFKDEIRTHADMNKLLMSADYVSKLLGIARNKQDALLLAAVRSQMENCDREDIPDWIWQYLAQFPEISDKMSLSEIRDLLKQKEQVQNGRCRLVSRQDLLPLLHYVARYRFLRENNIKESTSYTEIAKKYFCDYANPILEQCGMTKIDEKYLLDRILLACFEKEDIASFAEVLAEYI